MGWILYPLLLYCPLPQGVGACFIPTYIWIKYGFSGKGKRVGDVRKRWEGLVMGMDEVDVLGYDLLIFIF